MTAAGAIDLMQQLATSIREFAEDLLVRGTAPEVELRPLIAGLAAAAPGTSRAAQANDTVRHFLRDMLAEPAANPIAPALAKVWHLLDWHYHYPERHDAPGLGAGIAFSEVAGPAALLHTPSIRVGFTFIAPGVTYPAHAHPAIELYVVLSGRALWTRSGVATWQNPLAVIVHASEEPHAMQTFDAPLLALYSWRGAISDPARYV